MLNIGDKVRIIDLTSHYYGMTGIVTSKNNDYSSHTCVYVVQLTTETSITSVYFVQSQLEIIEKENNMNENYLMLNGKRVDLTEKQIKQLGLKVEKEDCFSRSKTAGKSYYFMNEVGEVYSEPDVFTWTDNDRFEIANHCTDKDLMQQRAYYETLSRLLWRFSMQNDGDKIDWSNSEQNKYYIYYEYKDFDITKSVHFKAFQSYFYTRETAQRAIDEIIKPFMKEHPDFVW